MERGRIIKPLFRVFVITKDRTIFDDHLREVFKSESRQTCEVRLNRKSGVEFYARLESIQAQDLNGNNVCRTSLIDITESKKTETLLKDERDFISAVLSTEGALVVVLDLQGRIVSFNKTCELITGYSFDEVKGKPGEPVFDKLSALLGHALFSIGAVKGVEFGAGFKVGHMKGSENNDQFTMIDGKITFKTNHAGGLLGGISTGEEIVARIAVKATPTISLKQDSVNMQKMEIQVLSPITRRDPTLVGRHYAVIEAMTAITLLDALMHGTGI